MGFLIRIICGYLIATIDESFFHRVIQHAPPWLRKGHRSLGRLGCALRRAWYTHHVVHHYLTFRSSHVKQFVNPAEKERLDRFLVSKGKSYVMDESYGSRIGPRPWDYLMYMAPTLPAFAFACWLGGAAFTLGAIVPFLAWPAVAQFVHPYIHMSMS